MKVAIVLCTLFAVTLAAVRPVPVGMATSSVGVRPKVMAYPATEHQDSEDRIVNGANDVAGAHPYQVSLQLSTTNGWFHTCGGSILNKDYILTAAHCVDTYGPNYYRVVAGEYNLNKAESSEQIVTPSQFTIHPDWNSAKINNDVAVIRLSKSLTFNKNVKAITLASAPGSSEQSYVTGWGYTNPTTQAKPDILQVLETNEEHEFWASWYSSIWDKNTQVATYNSNKGICNGDSGGPLVYQKNGEFRQYGVCSYVLTPCGNSRPDYYARVSFFQSWIEANSK